MVRRLSNAGRFSVTLADSAHTDESQFPRTLGELSETSDSSAIGDIYASQFYPQPEGWTLFIATTSTMSTGTGPGRSLAGSDQQAAQP